MTTLVAIAVAVLAAGCQTTIAAGLAEEQANRVVVALDAEGISAAKDRSGGRTDESGFDVAVANDDVARALAVLEAADLPRQDEPGLSDVFGEASLVPTATEERARYMAALSGELTRSIESLDGVLDARVHVALPEQRDFMLDQERPGPRASVLIKRRHAARAPDEDAVQRLVAGAVHGMRPEDVAVVSIEAAPARPSPSSLVRVGPISVTRGTATILKAFLGGSLGLHVLLAALLVFVLVRRRGTQVIEENAGNGAG